MAVTSRVNVSQCSLPVARVTRRHSMGLRIVQVHLDLVVQYFACRSPVFPLRPVGRLAAHCPPQDCLDISRLVYLVAMLFHFLSFLFLFFFDSIFALAVMHQWSMCPLQSKGFQIQKIGHQIRSRYLLPRSCRPRYLSSWVSFSEKLSSL